MNSTGKRARLKPHQAALLVAGVASAVLWAVPYVQFLTLPLIYLNTLIHEICHALAAMVVGGRVQGIWVFGSGGGQTPVATPGGLSILLVASAGYVGATLIGASLILLGRNGKAARNLLWTIAGVLLLAMVLWVRGDEIGIASGIFWIALLWAGGRYLSGPYAIFAVQFLGLQQCLNALQSVYTLLEISAFTEGQSDARLMEQASMVPAIVWAVLWGLLSLVLVAMAFRRSWSRGG